MERSSLVIIYIKVKEMERLIMVKEMERSSLVNI